MNREAIISRVLDDEGLAGDLDGPEAESLIAWAVRQAEQIAKTAKTEKVALTQVEALCRRARGIARLVTTACHDNDPKAAETQARKDGLPWPIPDAASPAAALRWLLAAR